MRHLRNLLYLVVGLLLGGTWALAEATTVYWSGRAGLVVKGPSGLATSVASVGEDSYFTGTAAGSARVAGNATVRMAGVPAVVTAAREIAPSALARVATVAVRANPIGNIATLALGAYLLLNEQGEIVVPEVPDTSQGEFPLPVGNTRVDYGGFGGGCSSPYGATSISHSGTYPNGTVTVEIRGDASWPGAPYTLKFNCSGGVVKIWSRTIPDSQCATGSFFDRSAASCRAPGQVAGTDAQVQALLVSALVAHGFGADLASRLASQGYTPTDAELGVPTTSGPASVPGGVVSSTEQSAQGTKTTTNTTTYNLTYSPNTVTVNSQVVSNVTNADGSQVTTTTTTTNPTTETSASQDQTYSLPWQNADFPEIPDFYTPEFPDGIQGVWDDKSTAIQETSIFSFLQGFLAGAPDGGTCPSWAVTLDMYAITYAGVIAPPCIIWPFLRTMMIISALLLARSLIFGG